MDEGTGQPAGDGTVGVEAAFAGLEVEHWAGQTIVTGEEPFAPFGFAGEGAGVEVTGEVVGDLAADLGGAFLNVGLDGGVQGGEAFEEAVGVLGGDGERAAAALVTAGMAGDPFAGFFASFGEGGVNGGEDANFLAR